MRFEAPQYARGISQLELIHSEGFEDALWSHLQADFEEVPFDFDLSVRLPLGKQAEKYVSQMIKNSSRYDVVLENHQVIEGKRTLGELDFIILDRISNTYIHLELATKFYLRKEMEWVGPNLKDRLDLKIGKYHSHQKVIIENEQVKSTLSELKIENVESQLLIIGQLYEKYIEGKKLSDQVLSQQWITYANFLEMSFADKTAFYIPTKKDWIVNPTENSRWNTREEMSIELEAAILTSRSQMIWMKDSEGRYSRFFVTWW